MRDDVGGVERVGEREGAVREDGGGGVEAQQRGGQAGRGEGRCRGESELLGVSEGNRDHRTVVVGLQKYVKG